MTRSIVLALVLASLAGCAGQTTPAALFAQAKVQANAATAAVDTFAAVEAAQGHPLSVAEAKAVADLDALNKALQTPAAVAPTSLKDVAADLVAVTVAFGPALPANVQDALLAADIAANAYVASVSSNAG